MAVGAIEGTALLCAAADTKRGCFAEEQLLETRRIRRLAEDGEQRTDAPFLHNDGGGHDVQRAVFERELCGVRDDLRAEVVDSAFEHADALARDAIFARGGLAEAEAQDIREASGVARPGAVPDRCEGRRGSREFAIERAKKGGSGGRDQFHRGAFAIGGRAAQE